MAISSDLIMSTLPWSQIDTVLLDMDGTLLDLHFDNYFWLDYLHQCYAQQHKISVQQARDYLVPLLAQYTGTLDWYCVEFWSDKLGLPIQQMKFAQADKIAPRPYALEFLQHLRNAGKQVVLITNAHPLSLEVKLQQVDLASNLDAIVSSHEYGFAKEQQQFWQRLQQQHPFDSKRSLFIDDSLSVLRSARQYGIEHLRCVAQPDSRQAIRSCSEFVDGGDFRQLIQGL